MPLRGMIRFIGIFDVLSVVWFTISLYVSSNIFKALIDGTGVKHFAAVWCCVWLRVFLEEYIASLLRLKERIFRMQFGYISWL